MTRMLSALLAFGLLAAACGSGGEDQPVATGTATSERAERQATVSRQQQPTRQVQQQQQTATEQQVVELPADIIGVHKGVRSERNILGEPDAPVEIRYFGDFT